MILNFLAVAEAATPAPDYTPALIGIGGVVIGGLIQTVFGLAKMRDEHAQQLRADVADFCHDALIYLGRVQQYVDFAEAGHLQDKSAEYRSEARDEVMEKYDRFRSSGYKLLAGTDQRIASFSNAITYDVATFTSSLADLFMPPASGHVRNDWPEAGPLISRVNELVTMVEPRVYERHSRFRSLSSAQRLIAKQREKLLANRAGANG